VRFTSAFRDLKPPEPPKVEEEVPEPVVEEVKGRKGAAAPARGAAAKKAEPAPPKKATEIVTPDMEEILSSIDHTKEEIIENWNKEEELWKLGAKVYDFYPDEPERKT
jgi:hypothetical protein